MSTCKNRSVVADSSGNLWDFANPNIIGIQSASSGTETILFLANGGLSSAITVSFSNASTAFNAS